MSCYVVYMCPVLTVTSLSCHIGAVLNNLAVTELLNNLIFIGEKKDLKCAEYSPVCGLHGHHSWRQIYCCSKHQA